MLSLSEPAVRESVPKILNKHDCTVTDTLVSEIVLAISESNILQCVITEGPLSTAKRRKSFF